MNNMENAITDTLEVQSVVINANFVLILVTSLALQGYQIFFKQKQLEFFSNILEIETLLTSFKIPDDRLQVRFAVNFGIDILTLIFSVYSIILLVLRSNTFSDIFVAISVFFSIQTFKIFNFAANLCFEIYLRLRYLNSYVDSMKCRQFQRFPDEFNVDNVLLTIQLLSRTLQNVGSFFEVELLIIFGNPK